MWHAECPCRGAHCLLSNKALKMIAMELHAWLASSQEQQVQQPHFIVLGKLLYKHFQVWRLPFHTKFQALHSASSAGASSLTGSGLTGSSADSTRAWSYSFATGGGGRGTNGAVLAAQPTYMLVKADPDPTATAPGHKLLRTPATCTRRAHLSCWPQQLGRLMPIHLWLCSRDHFGGHSCLHKPPDGLQCCCTPSRLAVLGSNKLPLGCAGLYLWQLQKLPA